METRITLSDTTMSAVNKMVEGNMGAVNAVMQVMEVNAKTDPDNALGGFGALISLDAYGIYGTDIYVLFNDICERDPIKMLAVLRSVQLGFFDKAILKDASHRQDRSGSALVPVESLYKKVCEVLPNFDKENRK